MLFGHLLTLLNLNVKQEYCSLDQIMCFEMRNDFYKSISDVISKMLCSLSQIQMFFYSCTDIFDLKPEIIRQTFVFFEHKLFVNVLVILSTHSSQI